MNARWITHAAFAAPCCTLAVPAHAGKCTGRLTPEEHAACQARRAAQPSSPTETTRDAERRLQEQKRKQQAAERERDYRRKKCLDYQRDLSDWENKFPGDVDSYWENLERRKSEYCTE